LTTLDPQSQAVVDGFNASGLLPFRQFSPARARQEVLALRPPRGAPAHEMASVSEETITTADGNFDVRILRPRAPRAGEAMAALIYFHGGGFFMGGLDETDHVARQIAKESDVVVVNVNYRHSPEFKFPVAVNDAYAALRWVAENAAELGIDPNRIVLSGDSAGGNLTIVTCLMARERGGPAIRFQVPIYPSLDLRPSPQYASRLKWGAGGYILDNDDIVWMLDHYLGRPEEGDDWRASPIVAKSYAGLPAALVITADHDPLCDEGKLYADRLKADGVEVEYAQFDGTFHGFVSFGGIVETATRAMKLICERIKQAVSR